MFARFLTHRNVYLLGMAGFLFGLAMSEFVISVSQFLLAANWLVSRNFKAKWERIKTNPAVWLIWFFYLLHIIGMTHTLYFDLGADELRIKLPFLLIPLFVVSEKRFSKLEMKGLLSVFVLAVILSSGFGIAHHFQHRMDIGYDARSSSLFISHIRLSLMIDLATLWLLSALLLGNEKKWVKIFSSILVLYLAFYLIQMQMLTGLVILPLALSFAFGFAQSESIVTSKIKLIVALFGAVFLISSSFYCYQIARPFIDFKEHFRYDLEVNTVNGNQYLHQLDNLMQENGNQVWIYISDPETRAEWNKRSKLDFDGVGNTGESLRATLYRYLTSKGARKDSVGMQTLTAEDILAIESGEANIRFVNHSSIEKRIYQTIWELNNYQYQAGSYEGHSVAQRIEFWKVGWQAFKIAPIFGNGTGDVRAMMSEQYAKSNSILSKESQLKPHNQFITTAVALGVMGLFSLIVCFVFAFKYSIREPVKLAFLVIILLSFISEDTLDTQVGATFFAGFYALFCCQPKSSELQEEA